MELGEGRRERFGPGVVAVILRLQAGIAIPKPRRNGDETANALARKGGVGQPIDSLLSGCLEFRIYNWSTQILPLCALKRRRTVLSGHVPIFLRSKRQLTKGARPLYARSVMHGVTMLINRGRTSFSRLTLGMRFERFLLDLRALPALLDSFVAMIISSFGFDLFRLRTIPLA